MLEDVGSRVSSGKLLEDEALTDARGDGRGPGRCEPPLPASRGSRRRSGSCLRVAAVRKAAEGTEGAGNRELGVLLLVAPSAYAGCLEQQE